MDCAINVGTILISIEMVALFVRGVHIKMKEIDGFKININYLGGPAWDIKIETPESGQFSKIVQVMGQLNEESAYQHFKETKGRDFFIDVSGEIVKD